MSLGISLLLLAGAAFLLGLFLLINKQTKNDDEAHIKVGKEWMTIKEYKKRYFK